MKPFINSLSLILNTKAPTEPGYYWWTNRGEHTPCVLRVTSTRHSSYLYASNGEYDFVVNPTNVDELWARIPNPWLNGEQIEPDSF